MRSKQTGFAHVGIALIVVVLAVVVGAGYYVLNKQAGKDKFGSTPVQNVTSDSSEQTVETIGNGGPKIKHLGVNLDYYDPATNKAGDFVFTKATFSSGMQMLFSDYGYVVPGANTSTGQAKANPQPTFILPLGSQVFSLVDGEVFDVPKLYSNDYSVQVRVEGSDLVFETEHVINVKVKKGDRVKAGQVVGEVSGYDARNYNGLGLVEIGVLKGGNPPSHLCPFDYLDASIKDETLKKITAFKKAWEDYRGDSSIYNETEQAMPGCVTRNPIEG